MDFAYVIKGLADFIVNVCSIQLVFNGIKFTVGSVFVFCGLLGLFFMFMLRSGD